jgi:hypothetical protein
MVANWIYTFNTPVWKTELIMQTPVVGSNKKHLQSSDLSKTYQFATKHGQNAYDNQPDRFSCSGVMTL